MGGPENNDIFHQGHQERTDEKTPASLKSSEVAPCRPVVSGKEVVTESGSTAPMGRGRLCRQLCQSHSAARLRVLYFTILKQFITSVKSL